MSKTHLKKATKIQYLLVAILAIAVSAFFGSSSKAAEQVTAGKWVNYTIPGGAASGDYVYTAQTGGYFKIEVVMPPNVGKNDTVSMMQVTLTQNSKRINTNEIEVATLYTWKSPKLSVKKGTKINVHLEKSDVEDPAQIKIKVTFKKVKNFEKENNNARKTANKIKQKTIYSGIANNARDNDYFLFKPKKAGKYKVLVNNYDDGAAICGTAYKGKKFKRLDLEKNIYGASGWNNISKGYVKLKKNEPLYIRIHGYSSKEDALYKVKVIKK